MKLSFFKRVLGDRGRARDGRPRALVIGVSIVGLAIVITVVAALGAPRADKSVKLPNVRLTSDQSYDQAVKAAESGDTTAAKALARKALSADPSNKKARDLVTNLDRAPAPKSDTPPNSGGGPDPSNSANPDEGFTTAIQNLPALLPASFDGYSLDQVVKSDTDVSVSATSKTANQPASHVVWSIHDMETVAAARGFLSKTSRELYPADPATVTVDGVQAYFGSDGTRFTTVAYSRGRYVFEVLLTGNGAAPNTLQSLTASAAQRFADSRPQ